MHHTLREIIEGFGMAFAAAGIGRLAYHVLMVRDGKRKWISVLLIGELFITALMAFVAIGIGDYFGLRVGSTAGIAAFLGYLGPRGIEFFVMQYFDSRRGSGAPPCAPLPPDDRDPKS